ncbi:MAG: GxxExxY protein [Bythopirellula sp.]|nr:GxxExxY protein [Bythopirellula sp.]
MHEPIPDDTEKIAHEIIQGAFRVHKALGPGLLESVYESCLCHELTKSNLRFVRQGTLPIVYDGLVLESGLRIDLLVEYCVVVELKSCDKLIPLHEAQLITYLKLSNNRLGLLINFNVRLLKDGLKKIVL